MIDIHTHILPMVDDGSRSVEESVAMLRRQAQQGITAVVATPHFYADQDHPETFLARRDRAEESLRRAMDKFPEFPQLYVGAEVHYFCGISQSDMLPLLSLRGYPYILIEMPPAPWQPFWYQELGHIQRQWGLTPIIAHVDRYISRFRTFGIPEELAKLPVLVQANGSFFLHKTTSSYALRLLDKGFIHLLGSDCHNLTDREPNLGQVNKRIENNLGQKALQRIKHCENMVFAQKS